MTILMKFEEIRFKQIYTKLGVIKTVQNNLQPYTMDEKNSLFIEFYSKFNNRNYKRYI
jgi:hypothetical protein